MFVVIPLQMNHLQQPYVFYLVVDMNLHHYLTVIFLQILPLISIPISLTSLYYQQNIQLLYLEVLNHLHHILQYLFSL